MRLSGMGARRIAAALNCEGVPCPSAHDPDRNRHRSGAGWAVGTVLAILRNPRYTGQQVWNKQPKAEILLDTSNVGLGTRTVQRHDAREKLGLLTGRVTSLHRQRRRISARPAQPREWPSATRVLAPRHARLLHMRRHMEGAWNNGRLVIAAVILACPALKALRCR